ncbi:MAG: polyprenyl synthetase family protein [Candidatus Thorarchaeota archaeon]
MDFSAKYDEARKMMNQIGKIVQLDFNKSLLSGPYDPKINDIYNYVIKYWKDYERPALISFACKAVGGNIEDAYPFGVIMYMLGSGIGIHDDIIDKTKYKHYDMTIPGKYGNDLGLITGDLLIIKSLTYFREIIGKFQNNIIIDIMEAYENFVSSMWFGEIMEISYRKNLDIDLNEYHESLYKLGTDAEACMKIGAIIGNATQKEIENLSAYGKNLGYINRLFEEIKDTLNIDGKLSDRIQNESIPLPILYASKQSKSNYKILTDKINSNEFIASDIEPILKICFTSNSFDYIKNKADKITEITYKKLEEIKPSDARIYLKSLLWKLNNDIHTIC